MTLEAALAVPLLVAFILVLAAFVSLSLSEAGLRSAVSQSAQQLAIQAYPLELLTESIGGRELIGQLQQWHDRYEAGKGEVEEWVSEYGPLIPGSVREALEHALQGVDEFEEQLTEPVRRAFQPVVAHYLPDHMEQGRLTIQSLRYPIFDRGGDREPYVMIEAAYEVPIRVPFISRSIILRATAWERMWIGNG